MSTTSTTALEQSYQQTRQAMTYSAWQFTKTFAESLYGPTVATLEVYTEGHDNDGGRADYRIEWVKGKNAEGNNLPYDFTTVFWTRKITTHTSSVELRGKTLLQVLDVTYVDDDVTDDGVRDEIRQECAEYILSDEHDLYHDLNKILHLQDDTSTFYNLLKPPVLPLYRPATISDLLPFATQLQQLATWTAFWNTIRSCYGGGEQAHRMHLEIDPVGGYDDENYYPTPTAYTIFDAEGNQLQPQPDAAFLERMQEQIDYDAFLQEIGLQEERKSTQEIAHDYFKENCLIPLEPGDYTINDIPGGMPTLFVARS